MQYLGDHHSNYSGREYNYMLSTCCMLLTSRKVMVAREYHVKTSCAWELIVLTNYHGSFKISWNVN